MSKILIIEDDKLFSNQIAELLESYGCFAEIAPTASDAMQILGNFKFDFVLLDWNLPDLSGVALCRKWRDEGEQVPIIFITGRDAPEDKEAGLDAGGDDYLTKPFDVRELLARMRTIQRRPRQLTLTPISTKELTLNPYTRVAKAGGQEVQLSLMENSVLEFFLRNRNCFFSGAQLFDHIWPPQSESSEDAVRAQVKLLRRKLAKIGQENLITTVIGSGYILRD